MKRRAYLELAVVGSAAGLLGRFTNSHWTRPATQASSLPSEAPKPPVPNEYSLCGVQPGRLRAEVERLLGKPEYEGQIPVLNDQHGVYVEYGNKTATWNGHPTIVYGPDAKAISVVGHQLLMGEHCVFALGDPGFKLRSLLGKHAQSPVIEDRSSECFKLGRFQLTVTFTRGLAERMVLSSATIHKVEHRQS